MGERVRRQAKITADRARCEPPADGRMSRHPAGATEVAATKAESLTNCVRLHLLEPRFGAPGRPVLGQSAQADFANFQRRIHSLRTGGGDYRIRSATGIIRYGRGAAHPTIFPPRAADPSRLALPLHPASRCRSIPPRAADPSRLALPIRPASRSRSIPPRAPDPFRLAPDPSRLALPIHLASRSPSISPRAPHPSRLALPIHPASRSPIRPAAGAPRSIPPTIRLSTPPPQRIRPASYRVRMKNLLS
jgi:hypothetical protein